MPPRRQAQSFFETVSPTLDHSRIFRQVPLTNSKLDRRAQSYLSRNVNIGKGLKMGMSVGIDLGTTNSVVSVKKLSISTLLNSEGDELTPSSVTAVPKENGMWDWVIGKPSLYLMKQYPDQTVTSVKRLMGREFDDLEVQNIINQKRTGYSIITDLSEPGSILIPVGGQNRTPEEISSLILKKVTTDASQDAGNSVDSAVVTVPAYFSDSQKFATRTACELAGLRLLRLLPEPTAAAISFGLDDDKNSSQTLMVFDLGGGTFDISILNVSQGIFMEIAKGGDMWIGGDNIDHLLTEYVFSKVETEENCPPVRELMEELPPRERARFITEIKEKCETAKIRLSSNPVAQVESFGILRDRNQNLIDIDVSITREEFEKIITPLTNRLSDLTNQLLREIRFEPELIEKVLMVGGSSLIPKVQDELKREFGASKVQVHARPLTAVAEGAAWMAAHLAGAAAENEMLIMHSVAHDYYIQLAGGQKYLLAPRNSPLPFSIEQKFRFATEEQKVARLRVFNELDGITETVGELWFHSDTQKTSADHREELNLRFTVDEDNIIGLQATSVTNPRRKVESQIARGGMALKLYSDLERTLADSIAHASSGTAEDDALRLSENIVNGILQASIQQSSSMRSEQKRTVQKQINNLGELIKKEDAPLSRLEFGEAALECAAEVLPAADEHELRHEIVAPLRFELENLKDVEHQIELLEKLHNFWKKAPIAAEMTRAHCAVENLGSSKITETIQLKMKELKVAYQTKSLSSIDDARKALESSHAHLFDYSDAPARAFDRDVVL